MGAVLHHKSQLAPRKHDFFGTVDATHQNTTLYTLLYSPDVTGK
jgi:hypothetical protein